MDTSFHPVPKEACNSCHISLQDIWIIPGCEHRLCVSCLSDTNMDCTSCRNQAYVECINKSNGCLAAFRRNEAALLLGHLQTCEYRILPCPNGCTLKIPSRNMVMHLKDDCPKRVLECHYCHKGFCAIDIGEHLLQCKEFPLKCQFCSTELLRKFMDCHLKDCKSAVWECELSSIGCSFKGTSDELDDHFTSRTHMKVFAEYAKRSEQQMRQFRQDVAFLKGKVLTLNDEKEIAENRMKTAEAKADDLKTELETYKKWCNDALESERWKRGKVEKQFNEKIDNLKRDLEIVANENTVVNEELKSTESKVTSLEETTAILHQKIDDMVNRTTDLKGELTKLECFENQYLGLEKRLKSVEEENEAELRQISTFTEGNEKSLIFNPKDTKTGETNEKVHKADALISCLDMFKESIKTLIYMKKISAENEDLYYYYQKLNVLGESCSIFYDREKVNAIRNVLMNSLTWMTDTYVLTNRIDDSYQFYECTSCPLENILMIVRFKFLLTSSFRFRVFALVSYSRLSAIHVEFNFGNGVVLLNSTLDLERSSPIYCGYIEVKDIEKNSNIDRFNLAIKFCQQ